MMSLPPDDAAAVQDYAAAAAADTVTNAPKNYYNSDDPDYTPTFCASPDVIYEVYTPY